MVAALVFLAAYAEPIPDPVLPSCSTYVGGLSWITWPAVLRRPRARPTTAPAAAPADPCCRC